MRMKHVKTAKQIAKIHGANSDSMIVAHQGTSRFYNDPSMEFHKGNPISYKGGMAMHKVKGKMKRKY